MYISNFKTLDNEFCKLHKRNLWRNPSNGRPPWNGQVWNHFGNFSPLRNFNMGRPPTRIRPQKKISLYFSTISSQPSKVMPLSPRSTSSTPWSPHLLSSAPLSSCFPSSAPSSPHLLFSAPLSPHLLWVRLRALNHPFECAFEPSLSFLFLLG